ncbi:sarcosine oxidase subunit gamma [Methylovirgula sp. 4M-Z18]|uniref:sarcosine oxidase subunit gamma n=1 Tax=Methylovirgula sp. 4M-Z18 TaxID=2293567 RepID=UPI000E2FCE7A|nr:sarcosine oxidase subunit gamma family protein [Methylovirgula sp. 4M-Z18]RFB78791.1 sarcosine oxidase subunit gamma family protein [Methylovirgula sp. 4M-Z18]
MVETALQRIPPLGADPLVAVRGGPTVTTVPPLSRFVFRGSAEAAAACGTVFGVYVLHDVCRTATTGNRATLWLGPDEWLLLAPAGEGEEIKQGIASALATIPHSLVDVSHRQTALEISGNRAAQLINAACPLNLDDEAFPVGMCTRTIFAKAEVVLWRKEAKTFHMEVWRSFAPYVSGLLQEAAFGLTAV